MRKNIPKAPAAVNTTYRNDTSDTSQEFALGACISGPPGSQCRQQSQQMIILAVHRPSAAKCPAWANTQVLDSAANDSEVPHRLLQFRKPSQTWTKSARLVAAATLRHFHRTASHQTSAHFGQARHWLVPAANLQRLLSTHGTVDLPAVQERLRFQCFHTPVHESNLSGNPQASQTTPE